MEGRELTPTEIEIKKKQILDQIRKEEEKDRQIKSLKNSIPDKKITSVRKTKKALKAHSVHPYMITKAMGYLKMISCYHNAARNIKRKKAFYKDICIDDIEKPQRISYYEIMMTHIEVLMK